MASNTSRSSGLGPSLLDRLTIDSGTEQSSDILRDLAHLLNATALSASRDLSRWPNVSRSVLNFGVAGFTGRTLSNADIPEVQRNITRAIQRFEPRLDPKSVQVTVLNDEPDTPARPWRVRIVAQCNQPSQTVELWAIVDAESGQLLMTES